MTRVRTTTQGMMEKAARKHRAERVISLYWRPSAIDGGVWDA